MKYFYLIIAVFIFILSFFIGIYSWAFPEKTDKQVVIDLFNGKILQWYKS